jgi:hypothetical protein
MRFNLFNMRLLEPALLVVLTLAYYKAPWTELPGPVEVWGIPFLIVYVLFLPGTLLRRTLCPNEHTLVSRVVLGFLFGLCFFLFVSFLWALTSADLAWLRLNLPGWIFLLYIVTSARRRDPPSAGMPFEKDRTGAVILLLLCVPLFIFVWKTGPPVSNKSDTLDHIAYVNEVQATGEAFPTSEFHAEAGENGKDIRKGLLHDFYGFTGDYLSIDGLRCLRSWNAVFITILIGSIYAAAYILFGNQWIALLSSVFFIIGGIGGSDGMALRETFYANRFGYSYFLFLIAFFMRYLKERRWRDLLSCACFAFAATAVHVLFAILCCFAVAVAAVWKVCFPAASSREHLRGVFISAAAFVAGILPYALYRYLTAYGTPNELHDHIQGVVYIGGGLFIANPMVLFSWFGLLGITTFIIALAMWRHRQEHTGLGYLIAAGFTIPLVLLNPFLLPLLHAVLTYLVFRLPQLFPFYMLAAYYVVHFIDGNGGVRRRTPLAWALLIGLFLAAAMDLLPVFQKSPLSPAGLRAEKRNCYLGWNDGLTYLRDNVPEGTVIVSDPLTSYSISAFTPHYVTCTLDQHAPPGDQLVGERLRMTREILTPFTPVSTSLALMESMDADYIVLNSRLSKGDLLQYWGMHPDMYFSIRDKFIAHGDLFRPRFHQDGFLVLEWNGKKPEDVEIAANPYFLQAIPLGFSPIGLQAGEAELEAYYLDNTHAGKGTKLEISFVWSGNQGYRLRNYVVEVRFNHNDSDLPFGGKPFPKLARKIKEVIKGERYRFRESHKILGGFLSPDVWPDNTFILDHTAISIPPDIASGQYTISVKLHISAKMPNYHIRDFFFDDDIYQGIPIDSVMID